MPLPDKICDLIRTHIDCHGQHLVQVNLSENDPPDFEPFVYTIGNHERGLPELLLIGPADDTTTWILNFVGKQQRGRGRPLEHGELVHLGGTYPVRIVDAGRIGREEYAVQVGTFYRTDDYAVRQILYCDTQGRFPDDPACAEPYRSQTVLRPDPRH